MTTRIICEAIDCIFNEGRLCSSEEIMYDPEAGCLTYETINSLDLEDEEDWEEIDQLDNDDLDWGDDDDFNAPSFL